LNFNNITRIWILAFAYYKHTVILISAIALLAAMFLPDSDPRIKLSSVDESERAAVRKKYESELFSLIKVPNIDYTLIDKLLKAETNINVRDEHGRTPIFYAVIMRNIKLFNHLEWKNADITLKDYENKSILDFVDKELYPKLYIAIVDANIKQELVKEGITVVGTSRSIDNNGQVMQTKIYTNETKSWTKLMHAIKDFDFSATEELLENRNEIESKTFNGSTPIFFAIKFNNLHAIKQLIYLNANIEHRNNNNVSVLGFAIKNGTFESVKMLVDAGVDTKAICDNGMNGYYLAMAYSKKKAANYIRYK